MTTLADIRALVRLAEERTRQDAKWGEQNHPDVDQVLMNRPGGSTVKRMAEEYEIPTPLRATQATNTAARGGEVTWGHILVEEVAEAIGAATAEGQDRTMEEVAQVGAVGVCWLGAIERRTERSTRVYISGPIASDPNAEERFATAVQWVQGMGERCVAVNPFDVAPLRHDGESCPSGYHPGASTHEHTSSACFMRTDLLALLACDAIYMLGGWERSKGATVEKAVAEACGMDVYYEVIS